MLAVQRWNLSSELSDHYPVAGPGPGVRRNDNMREEADTWQRTPDKPDAHTHAQEQSPFFQLPLELRDAIYRFALLNGGTTQHVHVSGPLTRAAIHLAPCAGRDDRKYLREDLARASMSRTSTGKQQPSSIPQPRGQVNGRSLATLAQHERRDGHLPCIGAEWGVLGQALALLRCCRRAHAEATHHLYGFHFGSTHDLRQFVSFIPRGVLDRVRAVEMTVARGECEPAPWLPLGRDDVVLRNACASLADMPRLEKLVVVLDVGDMSAPAAPLTPERKDKWLGWLADIRRPHRFEVHLREVGVGQSEFVEPARPDEGRPFSVHGRREPAWVYGQQELIEDGLEALDRVYAKYSKPMRG